MLRFPLILAVIFIHNFPEGDSFVVSQINWHRLSIIDMINCVGVLFSHIIFHIAVPTFFLISGYLFFYRLDGKFTISVYWTKMKRRGKSLLIPYIYWNFIALFLIVLMKLLGCWVHGNPIHGVYDYLQMSRILHYFWDSASWSLNKVNAMGIPCPMTAPIDVPLWYLRNLMVVCMFTPFIYLTIKKMRKIGLAILLVLYICNVDMPISGFSIQAFSMFAIGAYMSICRINLISYFWQWKKYWSLCLVVIIYYLFLTDGEKTFLHSFFYASFTILGTLLLIGFVKILSDKNPRNQGMNFGGGKLLLKSSFFVYASHTLGILDMCRLFIERIFGFNQIIQSIMLYFLSPILCSAICISLYLILQRYSKKSLHALTGARC